MEVPDYRSFILMSMKELPMEFSKRELCNSHSQTLRRIYPEILTITNSCVLLRPDPVAAAAAEGGEGGERRGRRS
jgi:hypothetical protein